MGTSEREYRHEDLPSLEQIWIPIWVFDPEIPYIYWGNEAAFEFWEVATTAELQSRDFTGMSEASRTRLQAMVELVRRGERPSEHWTFYPHGRPKRVKARRSAFRFEDGRLGLLTEAIPLDVHLDSTATRALEAINYLSTMVCLYTESGEPLLRNPAAARAFGPLDPQEAGGQLGTSFADPTDRERVMAVLQRGEPFIGDLQIRTLQRQSWHRFEARWTIDPVTGDRTILTHEVCVDATHQAIEKLHQSREEAERANRARSLFLATVSHELRTPLSGMMNILELMKGTPMPTEQREHLDLLSSSSDLLLTVINDLLDFTKIDAGQLVIERIAYSPAECLQSAMQLCQQRAQEKGLPLKLVCDPRLPALLLGDPTRLRQVLLNLLNNAIKFTQSGSIQVTARRGAGTLIISVQDTGIGIDPKTQRKLFEPFVQGPTSISRRFGGTGLGLAISRRLIGLMGGTITVESIPGEGSTFQIELPIEIAHATTLKAPPSPSLQRGESLLILLVEDNPVNRRVVSTLLARQGHRVITAEDGEQAVARVRENEDLDAVLMDIQMPVMNGVDATKIIRTMPPPQGTLPILALTADALREDLSYYRSVGFSEYLTKPIDWKLLLSTLQRLCPPDAPP